MLIASIIEKETLNPNPLIYLIAQDVNWESADVDVISLF